MARALGTNQLGVLNSIVQSSMVWFQRCGWTWGSDSETRRLCESLVKRGLLREYEKGKFVVADLDAALEIVLADVHEDAKESFVKQVDRAKVRCKERYGIDVESDRGVEHGTV